MKIYASLTSPYARKIRVLCLEKGIPFDLEEDIPWNPETRVPEFNPLGKVPVVVCDDGQVMYDSPLIASYLEILKPQPAFMPPEGMPRIHIRLVEALADGVTDAAAAEVVERRRPAALQSEDWVARQRGKVARGLDALEHRLGTQTWFDGAALSIADISTGCLLAFLDFRLPDLDWRTAHPNLHALSQRLATRPSFMSTQLPGAT